MLKHYGNSCLVWRERTPKTEDFDTYIMYRIRNILQSVGYDTMFHDPSAGICVNTFVYGKTLTCVLRNEADPFITFTGYPPSIFSMVKDIPHLCRVGFQDSQLVVQLNLEELLQYEDDANTLSRCSYIFDHLDPWEGSIPEVMISAICWKGDY